MLADNNCINIEQSVAVEKELKNILPDYLFKAQCQDNFSDIDYIKAKDCLKFNYEEDNQTILLKTICRFSADAYVFMD